VMTTRRIVLERHPKPVAAPSPVRQPVLILAPTP